MARGQVQSWNGQTGFLVDEADGQRVFFGDRSLRGLAVEDIRPGMVLEFDRGQGPKGPRANNVRQPRAAAPLPPRGTVPAMPPRPSQGAMASAIPEPPEEIVLPRSTQSIIRQVQLVERHPGLQLDRLVVPGNQERQREALLDVTRVAGDDTLFAEVSRRRQDCLRAAGVEPWKRTTAGPLTLHLARSNALENAGLCLHPIYGFAYLLGSGIKGMTRAYAETVWLPGQRDLQSARKMIEEVFGNKAGEPEKEHQRAGVVIFHDAWPAVWPKLVVDIVNNHHPRYYQGEDAPGDWDAPNPVYFLAVPAGTAFEFALGKRRADAPDALLDRAREWLDRALTLLGAGAKTAAGYGSFVSGAVPQGSAPLPGPAVLAACAVTLELTTPAFLAGAGQQGEDCDLRPATLRGLLRWWWRTMHAEYVDVATLRRMEAAIWGDTAQGGALQTTISPVGELRPLLYDKRSKASMTPEQKKSEYGIPGCDPGKTTQGLWYASFGMDETSRGQRKQRYYLGEGSSWSLRLTARRPQHGLAPEQALDQARAALWLLCTFGGVGSKSRKGFGSLAVNGLDGWNLDTCTEVAARFRQALQVSGSSHEQVAASSALGQMLGPVEASFSWSNVWEVLDQAGFAYQAFAKRYKHHLEKKALGLPHRIGPGIEGRFEPTGPVKKLLDESRRQRKEDNVRHASPIHIHLSAEGDGFIVRAVAFPARYLPDLATSKSFLREFLQEFGAELERRSRLLPPNRGGSGQPPQRGPGGPPQGQQRLAHPAAPVRPAQPSGPILPRVGDRVEAELLEEKTKKGGWRAKHLTTGIAGPIQNSNAVPADKKAGDRVPLIVKSANAREIAFAWPA